MFLSLEELRLIITALSQLDLEYGDAKAAALAEKVRAEYEARKADAR